MKEEKAALRKAIWAELAKLSPEEMAVSDEALFENFLALPEVQNAKVIFAFWGIPGKEPNTRLLIEKLLSQGKIVGLPRMMPGRQMEVRRYDPAIPMVKAAFGIEEPSTDCPLIPKQDVDFVLTPAVAYDRRGYRTGFGGGYYDRWLEHYEGVKIGLCPEKVLRDHVPVEPHDTHVDAVVTETQVIRCK
jgi:5-formyltetrahydrofolate cyclo-ligase